MKEILTNIKIKLMSISLKLMGIEIINDHPVLINTIKDGDSILDIGGNKGGFSISMIEKFGIYSYCFEANPRVFEIIPSSTHLKKYNFAVSIRRFIGVLYIKK